MLPGCLQAAWLLASSQGPAAAAQPPGTPTAESETNIWTLTNAAQVLELSSEQCKARPPVQIRGMVTFYEPGVALFVQDETAGVFVYHTASPLDLKAGQYAEVSGFANSGRFSPIIDSPRIRPIPAGPTIHPQKVSLADIYFGALDAQWVELTGIVRAQKNVGSQLELELAVAPNRIKVWIPHGDEHSRRPLVGNPVRLRGVVGTVCTAQGQLQAFQLFVSGMEDVAVLSEPASDPFSSPLLQVADLKTQHARALGMGRVRAHGVVTLALPGRIFIQDSTGGLPVFSPGLPNGLTPGDTVEATGFLGSVLEEPRLEDAVVRKIGPGKPPPPVRVQAEELFHGHHNHELVELEGKAVGQVKPLSNGSILAIQADNHFLTAQLDSSNPVLIEVQPGSRVQVIGVSHAQDKEAGGEPAVSLLLRAATDLKVIEPPASTRNLAMQVLPTAAILGAAGVVLAMWYIRKQRHQTEHVLQLQASLQAEMKQGQQQLRRSMDERERMGRDLHDDIIQSIYAVGLNLEECRRVLVQTPQQAESRLAAAINMLNGTIRSVRGFITGLEPKVLNGREFRTALKSLALTSGDDSQFEIEVDPAAAGRLSSTQATHLLHISKEAMSNSLRHAQASSVAVSLYPVSKGIRLEVRDNGAGFHPEKTDGVGHGLRNMTARAREISADLQILSAPGQGCRILVTVPQGNAHEPD